MQQLASNPLNNYRLAVAEANQAVPRPVKPCRPPRTRPWPRPCAANTTELNSDRDQYTADGNTANVAYATGMAAADENQSVGYAAAAADLTRDTADAQATQAPVDRG